MAKLTTNDFRNELNRRFQDAVAQGKSTVVVLAEDLHKSLNAQDRFPMCCNAMWGNYEAAYDHIICSPPKKQGSSLEIEYIIPRPNNVSAKAGCSQKNSRKLSNSTKTPSSKQVANSRMGKGNWLSIIETALLEIPLDEDYVEATLQFKLLMQLAKTIDKERIWPERNIGKYNSNTNFIKKEIDILIEDDSKKPEVAIELKMPMNGQVPEQMFSCIKDIAFLEQLCGNICKYTYLIFVTNDHLFWEGRKERKIYLPPIYSYFREKKILTGIIQKPTGKNTTEFFHELRGQYSIIWKDIPYPKGNGFKYFIVSVS